MFFSKHFLPLPCLKGALLLSALAAAVEGCGTASVTRGADLYAQGDYVGADEWFEHAEPHLRSASEADRARYGLYRAATLLTLGDPSRAKKWLLYTVNVVQANPNALSEEEHLMLERALAVRANQPEQPAAPSLAAR